MPSAKGNVTHVTDRARVESASRERRAIRDGA